MACACAILWAVLNIFGSLTGIISTLSLKSAANICWLVPDKENETCSGKYTAFNIHNNLNS